MVVQTIAPRASTLPNSSSAVSEIPMAKRSVDEGDGMTDGSDSTNSNSGPAYPVHSDVAVRLRRSPHATETR